MLEVPNRAAAKMKEMIDPNGPGYLQDKPYETFLELRNSEAADDMTACAILHALVRGAIDDVKPGGDRISLSKAIQDKCSLQGDMADCLADIFLTLYSPSNVEQWDRMRMHGLELFAEKPFDCSWEGFAIWDGGNGTVDCHYRAKIVLSPRRPFTVDGELAQILGQNPFTGAEAPYGTISRRTYAITSIARLGNTASAMTITSRSWKTSMLRTGRPSGARKTALSWCRARARDTTTGTNR